MKGIDISRYQGNVDFNKVKASGVEIVYIKATEGKTYIDPNFEVYYKGAKAAGLKVGVYHFLRNNSTQDEINNFLKAITGKTFDCKVVIDMETNFGSVEVNSQKTRAFADTLIEKGYDIALYTGEYFYIHNLDIRVKNLPLWVAKYSTFKPNIQGYIGWQYSSDGTVPGINGRVDVDDFASDILIKSKIEKVVDNMDVKLLQHVLNKLDIKGKDGKALVEDGKTGPNTDYAKDTLKSLLTEVLR